MVKTGENIKALREACKYTQVQLAKLAGIGENYLSDLETGKKHPGKKSIAGLCDALGVDEQTLLYGKHPPPQDQNPLYAMVDRALKNFDLHEQHEFMAKIFHAMAEMELSRRKKSP